jgi:hypothetical protein
MPPLALTGAALTMLLMKTWQGHLNSHALSAGYERLCRVPKWSFLLCTRSPIGNPTEDMAVCSVVKAELFYGAFRSNNPQRTLERQQAFLSQFVSLPFQDEDCFAGWTHSGQASERRDAHWFLRFADCRDRFGQQPDPSYPQHTRV